jgi:5-keto-L-gluconate epimerase
MNPYSQKKMKLACTIATQSTANAPVLLGGDLEKSVKTASELGYHGVELHWADPQQINLDRLLQFCDHYRINVSAFATGRAYVKEGLSLIHEDRQVRQKAVSRLKNFIDAAVPFQAAVIIGCIRGNLAPGDDPHLIMERLAESTHKVAKHAAAHNVSIVFEAINRYENNYLNTASETLDFIRKHQFPNTKVLLDTFHMNIEDPDLEQAILDSGDLLGYVHFADSNRWYVGAGHIDFQKIMQALNRIGYDGYISAECLPLPASCIAAKQWIDGVRKLIL